MSITGLAAQGLGAYSGILQALAGPPVTIGGIGLTSLEVPATMPFGGTQKLVVHDLVGGGRQIDALGAFEDDITWSGMFTGPSAVSRARALDALRQAGNKVTLTWADFTRQVVIRSFVAQYGRNGAMLTYSINLAVLPSVQATQSPGLLQSIASDISSAIGLPAITAAVAPVLTAAQAALPVVAVLTHGSPAFLKLSSAVGTASSVVSGAQALADSQLSAIGTSAAAAGQTFGPGGLAAASAAQNALAAATQAAAFIGRAAKNLI